MIPNNTIEDLVLNMDMLLGYTSPLVSRSIFFVAPEDHYSPTAEHITTDIKEVPSDTLLPLKIEVQQNGLTDQPVVNIQDVNESFEPKDIGRSPVRHYGVPWILRSESFSNGCEISRNVGNRFTQAYGRKV
jgi:hypothetical protein